MRPTALVAVLACTLSVAPLAGVEGGGAAIAVSLNGLAAAPQTYQSTAVRFRAIFVERGGNFDPLRTQFTAERFHNLVVWDERARLWEPAERAKAVATLYVNRDRALRASIDGLAKYQVVEIEGTVTATTEGMPWIEVTALQPVPGLVVWNDAVVAHLEQAAALAADNARDLAEEHFAAAVLAGLPRVAQAQIAELRGRSLLAAARAGEAAKVLRAGLDALEAGSPSALAAALHTQYARALNEARNPEAAAVQARAALAIDPTLSDAYAILGMALATDPERLPEARLQCERAVRMRPADPEVRLALGRILDRQGRGDEAVETLKRAIDLAPKDHRNHLAIAEAYFNRARAGAAGAPADFVIALRECDITLRLQPRLAEAQVLAGTVLAEAAERNVEVMQGTQRVPATKAMAEERFRAAIALDPGNAAATAALEQLNGKAAAPEIEIPAPKAAPAPTAAPPAGKAVAPASEIPAPKAVQAAAPSAK